MTGNTIHIRRTQAVLRPDQSRVLLRPFRPGDSQRVGRIISRIISLPEDEVHSLLEEISADFSQRHSTIRTVFHERFEQVRMALLTDMALSEERQLLIGAY